MKTVAILDLTGPEEIELCWFPVKSVRFDTRGLLVQPVSIPDLLYTLQANAHQLDGVLYESTHEYGRGWLLIHLGDFSAEVR